MKNGNREVTLSTFDDRDGTTHIYLNNCEVELYVLMEKSANVGNIIQGYVEMQDKILAKSKLSCKRVSDFFSRKTYLYCSILENQNGNVLINNYNLMPSTEEYVVVSAREYYMKMICPQDESKDLETLKKEFKEWLLQEANLILNRGNSRKRAQ